MKMECYKDKPLDIVSGIPIFSKSDYYINNYNKIGNDLINNLSLKGENPFMESLYWKNIQKSTIDLVNFYLNPNDKILDVGVGLGGILGSINKAQKYGVDIDIKQLTIAKKKNINVCLSKVEDLPYKERFFDIIVCTDVLEHVIDLNLSINNIIKCLKNDGILIVRVPNNENLSPYLEDDYPYEYAHLRDFNIFNLKLIFTKIFSLQYQEHKYTGYEIDRNRLKILSGLPILKTIFCKLSLIIKKNENFLKKYYDPKEINIVFKKTF